MQNDFTYHHKLEVLTSVIRYCIYGDETNKLKRTYIKKIRRLVSKYMDTKDEQTLDKIIQLCYKYKEKSRLFVSSGHRDMRAKIKSQYSYFSYDQIEYLYDLYDSSHVEFFQNLIFLLREYHKISEQIILDKSRKEKQKEEINEHGNDEDNVQTDEKSDGNVKSGIVTLLKEFVSMIIPKDDEDEKHKSDTDDNDIKGIAILVKKLMSIIKSKKGEYIINDVSGISNDLKELVKDLIELQRFERAFKENDRTISRKYEILSNRIYQYLHLKANYKLTKEEKIMLILLEKNNILGLLEKNKQYHGPHNFSELIPDINKKIVCDLDELFGYRKDYFYVSRMGFDPEHGWGDFKTSVWELTYLMPISDIKALYDKYRGAFSERANTRLNHGYLQTKFCFAIKYNRYYKSLLKNNATKEEKEAEQLFICAAFLGVMPVFIESKEELYKKILTDIKNEKTSAAMCEILDDISELNVIDIPSVSKKNN